MTILCPGSGISVAVKVVSGSGTICAYGAIDIGVTLV